ncbi:DUF3267 domain-containing protein [Rummeliibacillus sp. G93]|uniref:Uncharacterized protein n=1 Tax=Rummeliibacillus stabekisii TaxID=241244 RepID=A0A143HEI7_9BACL|nr:MULTISPECIES: DUF3267 domain-containing protein [Rummeliibacillus]AMW99849.1 hypothetical protein ATY39_10595 [Rummeliibacillus stabekisii]MBB5171066.1 asparagine N-glycosylation enzyme membrane subunit Stt3 [Rummeliibacillus stabekisii]MCM3317266.1 DUF3267 domain-containing protein [Rummeliibacillus stabekisii]UQW96750.1 DUF3267 domain-containing protein [Rummeliibacillus sp. G93]GEL05279.1 hypothetical protein RST01_19060 [Rummeliibacillus stabekisii]
MHCWKHINVKKQYGHHRLFLFSAIFMLLAFSFFYITMTAYRDSPVTDRLFPLFLAGFLMVYPAHKLLHFLPLARCHNRLRFKLEKQFGVIPLLSIRITEPIIKLRYMIALTIPFVVLNSILIMGGLIYSTYRHYFAILLAYHCGLCVIDLLYVKHLIHSPKKAFIEETDKGFEILISYDNESETVLSRNFTHLP